MSDLGTVNRVSNPHLPHHVIDQAMPIAGFVPEKGISQTIDNPFGTRLSPLSQVRHVTIVSSLDNISMVRAMGFEPMTY
jgi:hypothetical protein